MRTERVAEVASDEVDASDRSQGSFQVRGPSLHGDGRRTSESSATSGLIDDVSLVENELGWAGKQDANPKPTVARRVRSHVTPRAPPDGLAKHGRDDVSKKGVVETRGLEARQQGNAIPRGHQRKTGDVRSKRQDVNRPVHDKRRRVGSGGQVPVNEEKVAGEDIIETLPMDLELDSLEEIDVTRKAELEKRRKEEVCVCVCVRARVRAIIQAALLSCLMMRASIHYSAGPECTLRGMCEVTPACYATLTGA